MLKRISKPLLNQEHFKIKYSTPSAPFKNKHCTGFLLRNALHNSRVSSYPNLKVIMVAEILCQSTLIFY